MCTPAYTHSYLRRHPKSNPEGNNLRGLFWVQIVFGAHFQVQGWVCGHLRISFRSVPPPTKASAVILARMASYGVGDRDRDLVSVPLAAVYTDEWPVGAGTPGKRRIQWRGAAKTLWVDNGEDVFAPVDDPRLWTLVYSASSVKSERGKDTFVLSARTAPAPLTAANIAIALHGNPQAMAELKELAEERLGASLQTLTDSTARVVLDSLRGKRGGTGTLRNLKAVMHSPWLLRTVMGDDDLLPPEVYTLLDGEDLERVLAIACGDPLDTVRGPASLLFPETWPVVNLSRKLLAARARAKRVASRESATGLSRGGGRGRGRGRGRGQGRGGGGGGGGGGADTFTHPSGAMHDSNALLEAIENGVDSVEDLGPVGNAQLMNALFTGAANATWDEARDITMIADERYKPPEYRKAAARVPARLVDAGLDWLPMAVTIHRKVVQNLNEKGNTMAFLVECMGDDRDSFEVCKSKFEANLLDPLFVKALAYLFAQGVFVALAPHMRGGPPAHGPAGVWSKTLDKGAGAGAGAGTDLRLPPLPAPWAHTSVRITATNTAMFRDSGLVLMTTKARQDRAVATSDALRILHERVQRKDAALSPLKLEERTRRRAAAVTGAIDFIKTQAGVTLDENQRRAVQCSVNCLVTVLNGPPGSGKSETLRAIMVALSTADGTPIEKYGHFINVTKEDYEHGDDEDEGGEDEDEDKEEEEEEAVFDFDSVKPRKRCRIEYVDSDAESSVGAPSDADAGGGTSGPASAFVPGAGAGAGTPARPPYIVGQAVEFQAEGMDAFRGGWICITFTTKARGNINARLKRPDMCPALGWVITVASFLRVARREADYHANECKAANAARCGDGRPVPQPRSMFHGITALIVEEASTLSAGMMATIMSHARNAQLFPSLAHIVLVGDDNQLHPIEPGAPMTCVLGALRNTVPPCGWCGACGTCAKTLPGHVPLGTVVTLDRVYRYNSGIGEVTTAVLSGATAPVLTRCRPFTSGAAVLEEAKASGADGAVVITVPCAYVRAAPREVEPGARWSSRPADLEPELVRAVVATIQAMGPPAEVLHRPGTFGSVMMVTHKRDNVDVLNTAIAQLVLGVPELPAGFVPGLVYTATLPDNANQVANGDRFLLVAAAVRTFPLMGMPFEGVDVPSEVLAFPRGSAAKAAETTPVVKPAYAPLTARTQVSVIVLWVRFLDGGPLRAPPGALVPLVVRCCNKRLMRGSATVKLDTTNIMLGYVITNYKSMGGEAATTMVVVPTNRHAMAGQRDLYVAVSRAKTTLLVFAGVSENTPPGTIPTSCGLYTMLTSKAKCRNDALYVALGTWMLPWAAVSVLPAGSRLLGHTPAIPFNAREDLLRRDREEAEALAKFENTRFRFAPASVRANMLAREMEKVDAVTAAARTQLAAVLSEGGGSSGAGAGAGAASTPSLSSTPKDGCEDGDGGGGGGGSSSCSAVF